jgi:hypothetical protein
LGPLLVGRALPYIAVAGIGNLAWKIAQLPSTRSGDVDPTVVRNRLVAGSAMVLVVPGLAAILTFGWQTSLMGLNRRR